MKKLWFFILIASALTFNKAHSITKQEIQDLQDGINDLQVHIDSTTVTLADWTSQRDSLQAQLDQSPASDVLIKQLQDEINIHQAEIDKKQAEIDALKKP